jgi:hypothetical protein
MYGETRIDKNPVMCFFGRVRLCILQLKVLVTRRKTVPHLYLHLNPRYSIFSGVLIVARDAKRCHAFKEPEMSS